MINFYCIINILGAHYQNSSYKAMQNLAKQVDIIVDETIMDNEPHYLIHWKNTDSSQDNWVPLSQLGPISEYLKDWLRKRRRDKTQSRSREKEKTAFDKIKPMLGPDAAKPAKKSKHQNFMDKILNREKTSEKYLKMEENCVEVDAAPIIESVPKHRLKKVTFDPVYKLENTSMDVEEPQNNPEKPISQEEVEAKVEETSKPKHEVKVMGAISTNVIKKILRVFDWKGIPCAELQLLNGRHCNMKQEELKRHNPEMLVQFLQAEGISF